jgi:IclR family acetate operon transcriptional repressor
MRAEGRARMAGSGRYSSLDRILDILLMFGESPGSLSVQRISEAFRSSRSSTYRYVQILRKRRLIEETDVPGHFRLGPMVVRLARLFGGDAHLKSLAEPVLQELASEFGESLMVTRRGGNNVHVLASIDSAQMVRVNIDAANNSPLHVGSFGKLHLAYLDARDVDRYLKHPLLAVAPHTVTDPAALRAELETIRSQGYALSDSEVETGMRSLSVPVLDGAGGLAAALTLAGPAFRMPLLPLRRQSARLKEAAAGISRLWSVTPEPHPSPDRRARPRRAAPLSMR